MRSARVLGSLATAALAVGVLAAAQPAAAVLIFGPVSNASVCRTGNSNDSPSSSASYVGNENVDPCFEAGTTVDNNAFRVAHATSGSGTSSASFKLTAGVAVDSAITASEFERGSVAYSFVLNVDVPGPAAWNLTIDQAILGLLAVRNDGGGSATGQADVATSITLQQGSNAFAMSVSGTNLGPTHTTSSQQFSGSRIGDVISGTGDAALTFTFTYQLDAFSDCSGVFSGCNVTGGGDEAAVLMGIDDILPMSFLSSTTADEYATWSRSIANDGYTIGFSLAVVPEPAVALLLGSALAGLALAGARRA